MLFLVVITLYIDSIMNSHQTIMSYKSSITSKVKVLKFKKRMNEMLDIVWKKRNYMDMDLDSDTVLLHPQKKPFLTDLLHKFKRHKVDFSHSHNHTCSSNEDTIEADAAQCTHCKQWFPDEQRLNVHTVYECQQAYIGNGNEEADARSDSDMFLHDSLDESADPLDQDHIPAMFSKGNAQWESI
eukprot:595930_1